MKIFKKILKKTFSNESGNILVLFALMLTFVVLFLAFSIDIGMAVMRRGDLMEIGQIMRDARLDQIEIIWHADFPEQAFDRIVKEYGIKNGLKYSQIHTEFSEENNLGYDGRRYTADIILEDTYDCNALALIGIHQIPISVKISGSAYKYGWGVWRR